MSCTKALTVDLLRPDILRIALLFFTTFRYSKHSSHYNIGVLMGVGGLCRRLDISLTVFPFVHTFCFFSGKKVSANKKKVFMIFLSWSLSSIAILTRSSLLVNCSVNIFMALLSKKMLLCTRSICSQLNSSQFSQYLRETAASSLVSLPYHVRSAAQKLHSFGPEHQESQPLPVPNFLSMRWVFVS